MPATALFGTVAREDRLGFWRSGAVDARKVVDFLDLSRADVAKVAGVAPASVRFDQKTPREVRDRIDEIANVVSLVAQFFGGDAARTALWFKTPNPMLGGIPPRDMIRFGRYERLLKFVLEALEENAAAVSRTRGEASPA